MGDGVRVPEVGDGVPEAGDGVAWWHSLFWLDVLTPSLLCSHWAKFAVGQTHR